MTSFIEVLKDQAVFGFTGKVNLLLASNSQFQGAAYLQEGMIVGAQYGQLKGRKALYKMIFDDVEAAIQFKFVVEPELIALEHFSMKMSFDEVRKEAQNIYQKFLMAKKLQPAPGIKLVVSPEIIVDPQEITADEFDILSVLSEWCTVADVYKYSRLMEFEVTNALVSLRKKRAIKVFQN